MIEEQAIVMDVNDQYVWVNAQRQSSCGHCSARNACGTQVLSKLLGNKRAHVRCLNSIANNDLSTNVVLRQGDRVIIGLHESALLKGSFLIYFLPLMIMIVFAALAVYVAQLWWPEGVDVLAVIAAIAGLFFGLIYSRQRVQKNSMNTCFEPVVLRKVPEKEWLIKLK